MFHGLITKTKTKSKLFFSTLLYTKLCPNWVSGFSDAESSFSLRIVRNNTRKSGWRVLPIFAIELDRRDTILLKRIQEFFGVGTISELNNGMVTYYVQSFSDLTQVIIPHFTKFPLLTKKRKDFILFSMAVQLLNEKAQSSLEGLQKIINIRASMNKGLPELLNKAFPNTEPVHIPEFNVDKIYHPNWLVGFVDGEGCFYVSVKKTSSKLGNQVLLTFSLTQHSRDEMLLNCIRNYLDCGVIEKVKTRPNSVAFVVYKFSDSWGKLIPFFRIYSLQSVKLLNFNDYCEIANLMDAKAHLTKEGIDKINLIKSQMNTGRFKK